jgi:hypothetical protein
MPNLAGGRVPQAHRAIVAGGGEQLRVPPRTAHTSVTSAVCPVRVRSAAPVAGSESGTNRGEAATATGAWRSTYSRPSTPSPPPQPSTQPADTDEGVCSVPASPGLWSCPVVGMTARLISVRGGVPGRRCAAIHRFSAGSATRRSPSARACGTTPNSRSTSRRPKRNAHARPSARRQKSALR